MTYSETSLKPTNPEDNSQETPEFTPPTENSMKDYYQLKQTLLIATLSLIGVAFGLVWFFYSLKVASNYLLGGCFSLVYLNMLAREVERVGTFKRRVGSTRLALFVGLMIVATQWQQLQIIPIFLGFITYKAAILFYILPNSLLEPKNKG